MSEQTGTPRAQTTTTERAALQGTLEALDALHADLVLRQSEAQNASARETYDEVLTLLDSLQSEYQRRHDALPPCPAEHASYVFLLDEQGAIHPLPHRIYVSLVRGRATAPNFAGQTLRLAEWYVRLQQDAPDTVVNETYTLLAFDAEGRIDWPATPDQERGALPSAEERTRMLALLFGNQGTASRT